MALSKMTQRRGSNINTANNVQSGQLNIPLQSQKAMATAILISNIFKETLASNPCPAGTTQREMDIFNESILEKILIVGGFPRDILLNRGINDIDIIINLRELSKLQLMHLNKYFPEFNVNSADASSNGDIYLDRYLQKFNTDSNTDSQAHEESQPKTDEIDEMVVLHDCNYLLNAKFWVGLLQRHELFRNSLSVQNMSRHGYVSCEIVQRLMFHNIDLDGVTIEFVDTFNTSHQPQMFNFYSEMMSKFHSQQRRLSNAGFDITENNDFSFEDFYASGGDEYNSYYNYNYGASRRVNHKRLASISMASSGLAGAASGVSSAFDVPVFSGKLGDKLSFYDFTINTLVIPFSNLVKNPNFAIGDKLDIIMFDRVQWVNQIEIVLEGCNAIKDLLNDRVLKVPLQSIASAGASKSGATNVIQGNNEEMHIMSIIHAYPVGYHFWRIVAWLVRQPEFVIDEHLLQCHMYDMTNNWFTKEYFSEVKHCERFVKQMKHVIEGECCDVRDVEQLFYALEVNFGFHEKLRKLLESSKVLKRVFVEVFESELRFAGAQRMKAEGFVGIDAHQVKRVFQLYKYPIRNDVEILQQENKGLRQKVEEQMNKIDDMEKEYQRVVASKVELLESANETINQLREYIMQLGRQ